MPQTSTNTFRPGTARRGGQLQAANAAVSVPAAGLTTLLDIDVRGIEMLTLRVDPTVQALDQCVVSGKAHPDDASYFTIANAGAAFTSPSGFVVKASGDLTTQAAGSTGWVLLDVRGLSNVKLEASANVAGPATVTATAGGM
ncbi:hypothetical protein UFOVP1040_8 [uncultured Caudovirales phage]|uniref:Uncharacterized protein n=1 Tax=uncultured Caudovirales phage TaxID=2100421 RepID=A0A6J5Q6P4_9CAUD|nr:hypothetical protein UFOVP1040_8 [uncultured Caudovirales phage]